MVNVCGCRYYMKYLLILKTSVGIYINCFKKVKKIYRNKIIKENLYILLCRTYKKKSVYLYFISTDVYLLLLYFIYLFFQNMEHNFKYRY